MWLPVNTRLIIPRPDETLSTFEFAPLDETYYEPNDSTEVDRQTGANDTSKMKDTIGKQKALNWDDKIQHRSLFNAMPPPQFSSQAIPARFV
jgi:hypothetical protein